ncbi:MAG: hypothetical protein IT242_02025 [Bacteroidia bacterium]|nr:hypothetical protein [Bacteroidia bacterium]
MKKLLTLLLLSFFLNSTNGQGWQWIKSVGGGDMDGCWDVAVDAADNIYVIGDSQSDPIMFNTAYLWLTGARSGFILKLDKYGNEKWVRQISSTSFLDFLGVYGVTTDTMTGSIIIAGQFSDNLTIGNMTVSSTSQFYTYYIAKIDSNGNTLWINTGGNSINERVSVGKSVVDPYGNIVAPGYSYGGGSIHGNPVDPGEFLITLDSNGICKSAKTIIKNGGGRLAMLNSDFIISGTSISNADTLFIDTMYFINNHTANPFVSVFDSTGHVKWAVMDTGNGNDYSTGRTADQNQGIYYYGQYQGTCYFGNDSLVCPNNNADVFLCKRDNNGNVLWVNSLQASYLGNSGGSVVLGPDGNISICGTYIGKAVCGTDTITSVSMDLFVATYSPSGSCLGFDHAPSAEGLAMAVDHEGNLICVGSYGNTIIAGNDTVHPYAMDDGYIIKRSGLTIGISEQRSAGKRLKIYANPTSGVCHVELPEALKHASRLYLNITDGKGRVVESRETVREDGLQLNLSAYARGTYYIELSDGKDRYSGVIVFQ